MPSPNSSLTRTQKEALLVMYGSDEPVRGGIQAGGRNGMASSTGSSLVGRGLANKDPGPANDRRGSYYSLTLAGRLVASSGVLVRRV
jgi:DNA-binding MarR family transcriptional regulator